MHGRHGASCASTRWRAVSSGAQRATSLPDATTTLGARTAAAATCEMPVSLQISSAASPQQRGERAERRASRQVDRDCTPRCAARAERGDERRARRPLPVSDDARRRASASRAATAANRSSGQRRDGQRAPGWMQTNVDGREPCGSRERAPLGTARAARIGSSSDSVGDGGRVRAERRASARVAPTAPAHVGVPVDEAGPRRRVAGVGDPVEAGAWSRRRSLRTSAFAGPPLPCSWIARSKRRRPHRRR